MDTKQWTWLYKQIKDYIGKHIGLVPDDKAAGDLMALHDNVMRLTANSRAESDELDKELKIVFRILTAIIQSLELEKKPL